MEQHSDESKEANVDENEQREIEAQLRKRKRLYTPKTRARRIVTAGPSYDTTIPVAESELLDFRNRVPPPIVHEDIGPLPIDSVLTSEYDASCESLDLKENDVEVRDVTESEPVLPPNSTLRCQESIVNDDPQEGIPPSVDAQLSFDAGYLASSDSVSTSEFRDVVTKYTQDPAVSQWNQNRNPEIRIHYQIIYDRFPHIEAIYRPDLIFVPLNDVDASFGPDQVRLRYRDMETTNSGGGIDAGSAPEISQSTSGAIPRSESQSDALPYDEEFESMLISRIQNRIREMAGGADYVFDDSAGLTPAGREIKQRFDLLQDGSDDEELSEHVPSTRTTARGRRRRRPAPDWMLTDVPSNETLATEAGAASPAASYAKLEERIANLRPMRYEYSRSPDSESDVSLIRDIRAEGGDQFVESVLWRLQQTLRPGHNFHDYRRTPGARGTTGRRPSQQEPGASSDEDSDAASSRSSTGRVAFHDKVLVRPLSQDPLLTEYRKPYSKLSKQKLSNIGKDYKPVPEDSDYEDSLKDKAEAETKPIPKGIPIPPPPAAKLAASPPPPKPVPAWKKILCCVSAPTEPPPLPPSRPPPSKPAASLPTPSSTPPASPSSPRRARRQVKRLEARDLDPDIPLGQLAQLHRMFDDQQELCRLSEPDTASSVDDPCNMSDVDSDADGPNFADFLKACGLDDEKIDSYMNYYRAHRPTPRLGRGDGETPSANDDDLSRWDKRVRDRRHEYRRKRREHRELQRQLETQRDLEVEAQLRRALGTQRELLREREVQRELDRTEELSREHTELRLEEEVLERELLRRLLAELQKEQARAREREKRRIVAKILEEELITRLTLEMERQREKSTDRTELRTTQRLQEDASTQELANRIEELRLRMQENKIMRDHEREEEARRLQLLEELLDKERRRMNLHESQRIRDQDVEAADRTLLIKMEEKSGDEEARSLKEYEECSREIMRNREKYKEMRAKLTSEVRKRELVKRKLISLKDIEKSNPKLYKLAKVMEETTSEKGCIELEYLDGSPPSILKNQAKETAENETTEKDATEKGAAERDAEEKPADGEVEAPSDWAGKQEPAPADGEVEAPFDGAGKQEPASDGALKQEPASEVAADEPSGDAAPEVAAGAGEVTNDGQRELEPTGAEGSASRTPDDGEPAPTTTEPDPVKQEQDATTGQEGDNAKPADGDGVQAEDAPAAAEGGAAAAEDAPAAAEEPAPAEGIDAAPDTPVRSRESGVQVVDGRPAEAETTDAPVPANDTGTGAAEGGTEPGATAAAPVVVTDPDGATVAPNARQEAGIRPEPGDDSSISSVTGVNDLYDIGAISD